MQLMTTWLKSHLVKRWFWKRATWTKSEHETKILECSPVILLPCTSLPSVCAMLTKVFFVSTTWSAMARGPFQAAGGRPPGLCSSKVTIQGGGGFFFQATCQPALFSFQFSLACFFDFGTSHASFWQQLSTKNRCFWHSKFALLFDRYFHRCCNHVWFPESTKALILYWFLQYFRHAGVF